MSGLVDPSQAAVALAECERITRARARNFYYGLKLTPQPQRSAMFAVYAWMRMADDLVDAEGIAGNREAETRLFHIHNLVLAEGGRLLLTARLHPSRWGLVLPDLASRMEATAVAEIAPPDDALLAAVLAKHFSDRQLSVQTNLLAWLVRRMDRSFAAARGLVAAVDARALARGTAVTRALAQEVLDSMGVPGNDADG